MTKIMFKEIRFSTHSKFQIIDLTKQIEKIVSESGIRDGVVIVFAPHATAALTLNESESGLLQDILSKLRELVPENGDYLHNRIDNNAHAHIIASIVKQWVLVPIKDGKLLRGTWQNILFLELDGPRIKRRVIVEILGS
jgi:secondary thiamine-phosphate synthase enzyme